MKKKKLTRIEMIFINSSTYFKIKKKFKKLLLSLTKTNGLSQKNLAKREKRGKTLSDFSELARHEYTTPFFCCTGIEEAILYIAVWYNRGWQGSWFDILRKKKILIHFVDARSHFYLR